MLEHNKMALAAVGKIPSGIKHGPRLLNFPELRAMLPYIKSIQEITFAKTTTFRIVLQ
jgi:hypothetical protein